MKITFVWALAHDFPNLFHDLAKGRDLEFVRSINCGDGWQPLIRRLSFRLEQLIEAMPREDRSLYRVLKIEERFGGLHFYMTDATYEMRQLIAVAAAESYKICELCGDKGAIRQGLKVGTKTLCDGCRDGFLTGKVLLFSSNLHP